MQCTGDEAIACAFQSALSKGNVNFPTYRQQGLLIAQGRPAVDMMCQILSNQKDRMKGRQLPVFYSAREAGFFDIRQSRHPVHPGGRLGHGIGHPQGADDRSRLDRRRRFRRPSRPARHAVVAP
ncbi:hypothetical protein MPL1032_240281 [Mesorhizobium plurifarium]|uniref:2-oxoisovalerate dehydrogenase subunit alpha n=1 Tax=Mesorhizobium plurifarium TaxID=69974 RepID=A0A0K2W1F0_MESPL|nr:hypothetical protein MPL1032_240281 [Mesorhizobium plurifarium]